MERHDTPHRISQVISDAREAVKEASLKEKEIKEVVEI